MPYARNIWLVIILCLFICPLVGGMPPLSCSTAPSLPNDFTNMSTQDKALIRDLKLLTYPPLEWKINASSFDYDVVIVGGGMAGLTVGAALFQEAIFNIKIFDQRPAGYEGPWLTTARMKTLRSPKDLVGPALDIPHLTFHAWFDAQWGHESWKKMEKIPTDLWMQYLIWYRQAMQLPVENGWTLASIIPFQEGFELEFKQSNQIKTVKAQKVILATGRDGFGGSNIPEIVKDLPKAVYAHTSDQIDFQALKDKSIGVIGVGASGFDAAAVALESGAQNVDLIMRRDRLPNVNKFASLYYKSFIHGFYKLSDQKRWDFMCAGFDPGIPPPIDALKRLKGLTNFHLRPSTIISKILYDGAKVKVETNQGSYIYDFLILATGFNIDGYKQPELRYLMDQISLWQDHMPAEIVKHHPNLGKYPYLGPTLEFLPKEPGTAPYLRNLYCFNYGATLSHALLSSDIPAISMGARRLAEGIAADFFVQESDCYLERLKAYDEPDFDQDKFF